MQTVSSSLTLLLKIFVPVFWIVFFTSFAAAVWMADEQYLGGISIRNFRMGVTAFLLGGIAFLYWTVMRLKRVEMDEEFVYVTNYFKNYRYPWHNIENIEERDFLVFRTIFIYFKKPGHFGKKITFLASRKNLNDFIQQHPHLFDRFA